MQIWQITIIFRGISGCNAQLQYKEQDHAVATYEAIRDAEASTEIELCDDYEAKLRIRREDVFSFMFQSLDGILQSQADTGLIRARMQRRAQRAAERDAIADAKIIEAVHAPLVRVNGGA